MTGETPQIRNVDCSRGLHRQKDVFRLEDMAKQCEQVLACLDRLVQNARCAAPQRRKDFCLKRKDEGKPGGTEAKLERALWQRWGPDGEEGFLPRCPRIQTYQFPLKRSNNDKGWGKVDLLGISDEGLPVVIELKSGNSRETLLRMVVEAAAYAIGLQQDWPYLKDEWHEKAALPAGSASAPPPHLRPCSIICAAPQRFWKARVPEAPYVRASCKHKNGEVCPDAWRPFFELLDALSDRYGLPVTFAAVEVEFGDKDPVIGGAKPLDIRGQLRKLGLLAGA